MRRLIILILILIAYSALGADHNDYYYYYKGEKEFLTLDTNAFYIKLKDTSTTALEDFIYSFPELLISDNNKFNIEGFRLFRIENETDYDILLNSLSSNDNLQFSNPVV